MTENRSLSFLRFPAGLALLMLLAVPAAWAQASSRASSLTGSQATAEGELGEELREAMVEFFRRGLADHVGLEDEQIDEVLPWVRKMEADRRKFRRDKARLLTQLRREYRRGGSDAKLRAALEGIDRVDREMRESQLSAQAEVDRYLSVRQQVQFRFYAQRFRRQLEQRIRGIQGDPDGSRRRPLREWQRRNRP